MVYSDLAPLTKVVELLDDEVMLEFSEQAFSADHPQLGVYIKRLGVK